MSVQTEVKHGKKEQGYPKLMIAKETELIVYMISHGKGTVINVGKASYELIDYADNWYMPDFEDFHGSVTLQNEL